MSALRGFSDRFHTDPSEVSLTHLDVSSRHIDHRSSPQRSRSEPPVPFPGKAHHRTLRHQDVAPFFNAIRASTASPAAKLCLESRSKSSSPKSSSAYRPRRAGSSTRKGRPGLGIDPKRPLYSWTRALSDPRGGTPILGGRHAVRMEEPTPREGAPKVTIHVLPSTTDTTSTTKPVPRSACASPRSPSTHVAATGRRKRLAVTHRSSGGRK